MTAALRATFATVAMLAVVALGLFWLYETTENPANQVFGRTVVSGPSDRKVVALTYDDGPNPPYTTAILSVLEQEDVHATFFLVGRAVKAYPGVVRREVDDGDAVGNHTWSHAHLVLETPGSIRKTLQQTDEAIYAAAGVHTHIMRPPFGARDWIVLHAVRALGYTPIMWSVPLPRDWENPSAQTIANRVLPDVTDGSIIVLHDGNRGIVCRAARVAPHTCDRESDIEATRIIVRTLKSAGYRFVTIPELLALKRPTRTPGPGTE